MADALRVQLNIRQNAEDLQDLLKDLDSWQDEMKAKDEELRHSKIITKQVCFDFRLVSTAQYCTVWIRSYMCTSESKSDLWDHTS